MNADDADQKENRETLPGIRKLPKVPKLPKIAEIEKPSSTADLRGWARIRKLPKTAKIAKDRLRFLYSSVFQRFCFFRSPDHPITRDHPIFLISVHQR